jgi:hypothetical protein
MCQACNAWQRNKFRPVKVIVICDTVRCVCRTKSGSGHRVSEVHEDAKGYGKPGQRPSIPSPSAPSPKPTPSRLLESCVVLRLEDFALYRVSSAIDDRRSSPRKFLASDKKQLLLPKNMSSVHVEFTEYYFPDGKDFPGM